MKNKIRLEVKGLHYSQSQSGAYALMMAEVGGQRRLPVVIGAFEAHSIAMELDKIKPSRPLTHDLFKNFAIAHSITIREVIINKFESGIFHAVLICSDGKKEREVDSRTSDAVAIALRFNCSIYIYDEILEEAGLNIDDLVEAAGAEQDDLELKSYESLSQQELQELLQMAVEAEDYEKASIIRDELRKRRGTTT
ncbi:MAG TPA: bifunctional nuclease domain-containing protein [Bacteroidales bacterium]|nr:bifunctional nuclease domain-containing protein [Bacteroidales bacterium]